MEIPEKYRGEMYIKIAPNFIQPIDVGHATAFGNKPSYVYHLFSDLEDLRKNAFEWIEGARHMGRGPVGSIVSFNNVNDDFWRLIKQAVTEMNRGKLDISQLEEYILEQR